MKNSHFLDELAKRLCDTLPDHLQKIKKDLEKNFQVVLKNAFEKLDLVTREEFDAQTKVLARSRKMIHSLEERLEQLEKSLKKKAKNDE